MIGSKVKHHRVGDVENLNIPLPPIEEQHPIVTRVTELMTRYDGTLDRIKAAQSTQPTLSNTITDQTIG